MTALSDRTSEARKVNTTSSLAPTAQGVTPCAECSIGRMAIYGPTCSKSPDRIQTLRKGVVRLRPNQTLLREGETSNLAYTIHSGWAYRFHEIPKGRRQILQFLLPGDSISLSGMTTSSRVTRHGVRAITNLVLCVFDARDLMNLLLESEEQGRVWVQSCSISLMNSTDGLLMSANGVQ
jgi:CRP-like cAMP-binding protein